MAERTLSLLSSAGISAARHPDRGLDHGAWVPLSVMFAQAQLPVTLLSLTRQGAATHFALGQALTPLRDEGVVVVASGAITQNYFGWLDWHARNTSPPLPKALAFTEWVREHLAALDIPILIDYRAAPYGAEAHPTEDHILPFFVALGAAGDDPPEKYHPAFTYGGLAMDAYAWGLGLAKANLDGRMMVGR